MINIERYITTLIETLKTSFNDNLLYVGLQGSYLRGEATEDSDIDIMIILDRLDISDLNEYKFVIQSLDHTDKSCGFICSKSDLQNWNPLEICHLLHTTKDYFGKLSDFIPSYSNNDIYNFIKISINNLYHEICNRYIHADNNKNVSMLPFSYKSVFFILQNIYYIKCGNFITTKKELLSLVNGLDFEVLNRSFEITNNENYDFDDSFKLLLKWCQETLISL